MSEAKAPLIDRRTIIGWTGGGILGFVGGLAGGVASFYAQRYIEDHYFAEVHSLRAQIVPIATGPLDFSGIPRPRVRLVADETTNMADAWSFYVNEYDLAIATPIAATPIVATPAAAPTDWVHTVCVTLLNTGDFNEINMSATLVLGSLPQTSSNQAPLDAYEDLERTRYIGIATTLPLWESVNITRSSETNGTNNYQFWDISLPRLTKKGLVSLLITCDDPIYWGDISGSSADLDFSSEWMY